MEWTTACHDWERKIVAGESIAPCLPLFPEQANHALSIFKEFVLVDVAGKPKIGDVTLSWVYDFVGAIFGAYDEATGSRLISEFFLLISKKNSKSCTAAGIMLIAMILNWRDSAEYLILAPTKEVADNSYIPMRDIISQSNALSDIFQVTNHTRTITHRIRNSTLKVVAADAATVGGKKATGVLIDELHLFGDKANADSMLIEATGGMASRPEGFVIYLSTQSEAPPAGVFKQKLQYARDVRDGIIKDKTFFPMIFEFPKKMIENGDYLKPENFYITNPNLNASVSAAFIEKKVMQSKEESAQAHAQVLAKHLNVEIGLALRSDRWLGTDFWLNSNRSCINLDYILENSEVIVMGLDGGGLADLLGINVLGRDKNTRKWLSWSYGFAHKIVLSQYKSIDPLLREYEAAGDFRIIENVGEDTQAIAEMALRIYDTGLLERIAVDPAEMGTLMEDVVKAGVPQELIIGVSQGWRLGGAIKTTERKLAEGHLLTADQKLMHWCVSNARVEPRGNAILITKQVSGKAKIDPLMALFNSVSIMAMNPESREGNYGIYFI